MLFTFCQEVAKEIQNQPTKVHSVKRLREIEMSFGRTPPTLRNCTKIVEFLWSLPPIEINLDGHSIRVKI